jgi:hypothetical protein
LTAGFFCDKINLPQFGGLFFVYKLREAAASFADNLIKRSRYSNASKDYSGLHGLQKAKLQQHERKEE